MPFYRKDRDFAAQIRQPREVDRQPPRLVAREQLRAADRRPGSAP
jgi:hypothetical protein